MQRILLLCVFVVCVLLSACGSTTSKTDEMSLYKGRFMVPVIHHFVGVGGELPKKTSAKDLTLLMNYASDKSLRVHGVYNDTNEQSKKNPIDFKYSLNSFPLALSFTYHRKLGSGTIGVSASGVTPFHGRFSYGMNTKHVECGFYLDFGFGFDKGSYDYHYVETTTKNSLLFISTESNVVAGDSTYSNYSFHFLLAIGSYVSFYYGPFVVSYSPSYYSPWIDSPLPANGSDHGYYTIGFSFPAFLSQYVGLSYWLSDHWKISGGATLMIANFDDWTVVTNASIGFRI